MYRVRSRSVDARGREIRPESRPRRGERARRKSSSGSPLRHPAQAVQHLRDGRAAAASRSRSPKEKASPPVSPVRRAASEAGGRRDAVAMQLIPIIELCRYCPGMVTALGVSMGLTAAAIMSKGTIAQKERWALDLLTLKKIGAWAITEPSSGSDAFGSMKSTARRDGDGYVLKATRPSSPTGRTPTPSCSSASSTRATRRRSARCCPSCSTGACRASSSRQPLRKMGLHCSPTGELFLNDVRVGSDRLLGESEDVASRARAPRRPSPSSARGGDGARDRRAVPGAVRQYARTRSSSAADRRVPAHPGQARPHGGRALNVRTWCSATSRWRRPGRA